MSSREVIVIIGITWAVLLLGYALNRLVVRSRFLKRRLVVQIGSRPVQGKPGSTLTRAGTLLVFCANIVTLLLVALAALSPRLDAMLRLVRLPLPFWVNIAGSVLFVLYSAWGLLVLFFNPNYTPLYRRPAGSYLIATEGPYRLVRHPRYSAEVAFNVFCFLFTGLWLPLVGILGWPALYRQAMAEDAYLAGIGGDAYEAYRSRTGMLLPRLRGDRGRAAASRRNAPRGDAQ